jgi:hypothetical protein
VVVQDGTVSLSALVLNTLMANNLLAEAFGFQRSIARLSADTYAVEHLHLLYTIFSVCDQRTLLSSSKPTTKSKIL